MENDNLKIYKRCYFIACAVILVDLIVKFNLMEFKDSSGYSSIFYAIYYMHTRPIKFLQDFFKCDPHYIKWWIFFWVEAALLTFLFCFNLFAHAKKGVLLGVPKWAHWLVFRSKNEFCLSEYPLRRIQSDSVITE